MQVVRHHYYPYEQLAPACSCRTPQQETPRAGISGGFRVTIEQTQNFYDY